LVYLTDAPRTRIYSIDEKNFYFRHRFLDRPEFKDGANAIAPPQSPNRSAGSADEKGLAIRLALADR